MLKFVAIFTLLLCLLLTIADISVRADDEDDTEAHETGWFADFYVVVIDGSVTTARGRGTQLHDENWVKISNRFGDYHFRDLQTIANDVKTAEKA